MPVSTRIASALETLGQLGAVDKDERITELGMMMVELPLDPHVCMFRPLSCRGLMVIVSSQLSKALLESVKMNSSEQMLTIAAMLSGTHCPFFGWKLSICFI